MKARAGRADIQGLRAFAVVVVILNHLVSWPVGGFVGVDVFFVISGFLITGLLLNEHARSGSISWTGFYRRRARRIVPAATVVLVLTAVVGTFVLSPIQSAETTKDAVRAFFFVSNWGFAHQSTNYFDVTGFVSPVRQYWSLSIEEQFYFVWPWVMLAVLTLVTRSRKTSGRVPVFGVITAITAASFAFAMVQSGTSPNSAYFSTLTRVWELGIGAMLAVAAPVVMRLPDAVRPVLSWVGLAGLFASLAVVTDASRFPAPTAALPVLACALVIAAGTFEDRTRQIRSVPLLTNRVCGWVGDTSYSLYLWHFPIVIYGTLIWGDSAKVLWVLGFYIVATSTLSYYLLEDPIRRSSWLAPKERSKRGTSRRPRGRLGGFMAARKDAWELKSAQFADWRQTSDGTRYALVFTAGMGLVAATLFGVAMDRQTPETGYQVAISTPTSTDSTDAPADGSLPIGPAVLANQKAIATALAATRWPDHLTPTIDDVLDGGDWTSKMEYCGGTAKVDAVKCRTGNGKKSAVILGDSISVAYAPALGEMLATKGYTTYSFGTASCQFMTQVAESGNPTLRDACPRRKKEAIQAIKQIEPDLVIVTNLYEPRTPVGSTVPFTAAKRSEGTGELLQQLDPSVKKFVVLAPPPSDKDLATCYTQVSTPRECVSSVGDYWKRQGFTDRAMIEGLGGVWVDSSRWFCVEALCPAFVDSTLTKSDQSHPTQAYLARIESAMAEDFKAARAF